MLSKDLRVLVVEDDRLITLVMQTFLRMMGVPEERVGLAKNMVEAKSLIQLMQFDLIITAQDVPGGSGIEIMELARELRPEIKLILVSGAREEKLDYYASVVGKVGHFGRFQRPVMPEKLICAFTEQGIEISCPLPLAD